MNQIGRENIELRAAVLTLLTFLDSKRLIYKAYPGESHWPDDLLKAIVILRLAIGATPGKPVTSDMTVWS